LEEVIGEKVERKYFPAIHEVKNAFSDHQKAREILGLECKTSLKEGLTKMWEWAQNQPKRELQTFDQFELEVGLPEQFKK
jgi:UDP-glucose 4-epimerase